LFFIAANFYREEMFWSVTLDKKSLSLTTRTTELKVQTQLNAISLFECQTNVARTMERTMERDKLKSDREERDCGSGFGQRERELKVNLDEGER
jgi:hypothetical protein